MDSSDDEYMDTMDMVDTSTTSHYSSLPSALNVHSIEGFLASNPAPERPVKQQQQPQRNFKQRVSTDAVPIGGPRSSEASVKVNLLCQKHGIRPNYEYKEFRPQMFGVTLTCSGHAAVNDQRFTSPQYATTMGHASKQAAKEEVSKLALPILESIPVTETRPASAAPSVTSPEQSGVNWVGKLLEYTQQTQRPAPEYQEYAVGTTFACDVTLGRSRFGDSTRTYPSKKAARAGAAREAVEFLEAHRNNVGVRSAQRQTSAAHLEADVWQPMPNAGGTVNHLALINELCQRLQMQQPEWRFEAHPTNPACFSGGAYFNDAWRWGIPPGLVVGEVRNILGKKRAKVESSKEVFPFLKDVEARRAR